jgi:putative inorganic carbon (HCO3(-)) transporter
MLEFFFSVYLLLLLLRPQEWTEALKQVPILQGLLIVCVLLWLRRGHKALRMAQFPLLVWFVAATVVSAAAIGWLGSLASEYQVLGPILLMFAVLTTVAQELWMMRRIMRITIFCACLMVLHGYLQLKNGVGWTGMQPVQGRITYVGIFDDPNDLGQLLVVCIAFCSYLRTQAATALRTLYLLVIGWLCYGIYLTDSRGTMLAGLAVFAMVAARRYGKIGLAVLGAMTVPVLALHTRFGEISAQEQSASDRIDSWYQGFQMFLSRPLTGVGLGQYEDHNLLTAHNSVVLPMAELGLLGFIPWFGLVVITARMVYWLAYEARTPASAEFDADVVAAEREAGYALLVAAVGFAVSAFFLSTSYKHMFFFILGIIVARFYRAREIFAGAPTLSLPAQIPLLVVCAFVAISSMWLLTRVLL